MRTFDSQLNTRLTLLEGCLRETEGQLEAMRDELRIRRRYFIKIMDGVVNMALIAIGIGTSLLIFNHYKVFF